MAVPKEGGECAWPSDCLCPYLETHTRIPDCPKWVPMGIAHRLVSPMPCVLCLGQLCPSRSGQWLTLDSLSKSSDKEAMISRPPGRTVRHLPSEAMVLARSCLPEGTLLPWHWGTWLSS